MSNQQDFSSFGWKSRIIPDGVDYEGKKNAEFS